MDIETTNVTVIDRSGEIFIGAAGPLAWWIDRALAIFGSFAG